MVHHYMVNVMCEPSPSALADRRRPTELPLRRELAVAGLEPAPEPGRAPRMDPAVCRGRSFRTDRFRVRTI